MHGFVELKVTGGPALLRALSALPANVQNNVARRAVRASAKPVIAAIKAAAPVGATRNLHKSIGKKEKNYRRDGTFAVIVGARIKLGEFAGQIGWIVEHGTRMRGIRTGAVRGKMPASHFAERAWKSVQGQSFAIMRSKFWEGIRAEAAKNRG